MQHETILYSKLRYMQPNQTGGIRMTNGKMLREVIEKSGFKYFYVAECMGISRYTLQNKLDGKTEFVASEIATLSRLLHLTEEQRELIFFS